MGGGLFEFPEHAPIAAFDGDLTTSWTADRYALPGGPLDRDRLRAPARRAATSTCVPTRDSLRRRARGRRQRRRRRIGPASTGSRPRAGGRHGAARDDHRRRPAGRGPAGRRRLPRDPHPRRRGPRAPAPAGRRGPRAGRPRPAPRGPDLPVRAHDGRRPVPPRSPDGQPAARAAARTARTPSASSSASSSRPRRAPTTVDAWVYPAVDARDSRARPARRPARRRAVRVVLGRFQNQPRHRASRAFDARADTAWMGIWARPSSAMPWISWTAAAPAHAVADAAHAAARAGPAADRRAAELGRAARRRRCASPPTAPSRSRGRCARAAFRLTVLDARFPAGATARERSHARGRHRLAGRPRAAAGRAAELRARCAPPAATRASTVGGARGRPAPRGTVPGPGWPGRPLRARGCGEACPHGRRRTQRDPLAGRHLRRRPAAAALAAPGPVAAASGGGRVLDAGRLGTRPSRASASPSTGRRGSSWARASPRAGRHSCDGRALGEPVPVNGYANGWRAPADCRASPSPSRRRTARSRATPISAGVCLRCSRSWPRHGCAWASPAGRRPAPWPPLPEGRAEPMALPRAAALAFAATAAALVPVRRALVGA